MDFKPKTTVASSMPTVSNGSLIATTDTGELYIDTGSSRVKLSDIVAGTESSIRAIIAPIAGKLYFATDTHKLLQATYSGSTIAWTELGGISASDKAKLDELDLGDLSQITPGTPLILMPNGTRWKTDVMPIATESSIGCVKQGTNITIASDGTISATGGSGSSTLAGLSDVTITSASSGQALVYNGSGWVNGTTTGSGGTKINSNYSLQAVNNTSSDIGTASVLFGYASSNTASGDSSVVSGGYGNTASGSFSVVSGGYGNTVTSTKCFAFGDSLTSVADNGYCFGSKTNFDCDGAIQTNINNTSWTDWSGHTGIIGKSFTNIGASDYFPIFDINTDTSIILHLDIVYVTSNLIADVSRYTISVVGGNIDYKFEFSHFYNFSLFSFSLINNRIYVFNGTGYSLSYLQIGIRYTVLGELKGESSSSATS